MLIIKEVIKKKGYSVTSLAEKIGMAQVSLSRIINGNPTVETLQKIANALDVDIRDLFKPTRLGLSEYQFEVINYDGFQNDAHEEYLKDKCARGWEFISSTYFIDTDDTPSFKFYFKKKITL